MHAKLVVGQIAGVFLVFALALFLPAGTIAWPAGWLFLVLFVGFFASVTLWLFKHNPGLLRERMRMSSPNQKRWDKALFPLQNVLFLVWLVLMSLDAGRFHWSSVPVWLQSVRAIVLVGSFYLFFLTFRENPYLSPVVRIQKERGQRVVSTGPYRYVRHPMYSAILVLVAGTALLLGSWYGVLFGLILMITVAWRAELEDPQISKVTSCR